MQLLHRRQRLSGLATLHGHDVGARPRVWGRPLIDARNLTIGDDLLIHSQYHQTRISGPGRIQIGDRVFINHGVRILCRGNITIGNDVALAEDVALLDNDAHGIEGRPVHISPVTIGDGAWVGIRSTVLPGVKIGARSIVAAGSIVTRSVEADTLVAGNPARVVRKLEYPPGVTRAWHDQ